MLDIYTRSPAGFKSKTPILHSAEFLRIELSAMADGKILTSLTATTVDEDEPQLLDQEVACERAAFDRRVARAHQDARPHCGADDTAPFC